MSISDSDMIFLVDSSCKLNDFQYKQNCTIIAFDYESHRFLTSKNIPHDISDRFLDRKELDDIENSSYGLAWWSEEDAAADTLDYEGVNIGSLFRTEFRDKLITFLKTFLESYRVFHINKNANFACSTALYDIMRSFTTSVTVLESKSDRVTSVHDFVEFPLKIGSKTITIRLKNSTFAKIQNLVEKIIIFTSFGKPTPTNATVLLHDFTTLRYRNLLRLIPDFSLNIVKYDRRTPAVWNYDSYSIVKKSSCIVENKSTLTNNQLLSLVNSKINTQQKKFHDLINDDGFFESFFAINGISFWSAIKPTFVQFFSERLRSAIFDIELTKKIFQKYHFNSILLWNESGSYEQIALKIAKNNKIPAILIQHGLYYDTDEMLLHNQFNGILPIQSDYFIAWGNLFAKYLVNNGIPKSKIHPLGNLFSDAILNKRISGQDGYILFATDPKRFHRPHDLTIESQIEYESIVRTVCRTVSKLGKKLIIKTHPLKSANEEEIAKEIDPAIQVIKSGDIIPLIDSCSLMIVTDLTTAILEAQILQKPVISLSIKDHYGNPSVFQNNSCLRINIDDLGMQLEKLLEDNTLRDQVINNGNKFVDEYLSNHGKSAAAILNFLQELNTNNLP